MRAYRYQRPDQLVGTAKFTAFVYVSPIARGERVTRAPPMPMPEPVHVALCDSTTSSDQLPLTPAVPAFVPVHCTTADPPAATVSGTTPERIFMFGHGDCVTITCPGACTTLLSSWYSAIAPRMRSACR